jgi:hypothetical protein
MVSFTFDIHFFKKSIFFKFISLIFFLNNYI